LSFLALYKLNIHPLKTGPFSLCYAVISNVAIVLCFIPFLLLGWKKMRQVNTYCVLGIYWFLNGLVNLLALDFAHFSDSHLFTRQLNMYYSLAEAPLVLLAFACARSGRGRRQLLMVLLLLVAGESVLSALHGHHFPATTVILASGLLLIIAYSLTGLVQYIKKMEHTRFENSMVFVYGSLLFAYGSFLIIYIFTHVRGNSGSTENDTDSFLLYYISLLLSSAVTSAGLWSYGVRTAYSSSSS
jgi:hypothetical protein